MTTVELGTMPAVSSIGAVRASLRRSRPAELPDKALVVRDVQATVEHLSAYDRACGFRLTDQLPVASRETLAEVGQARGVRMSFAAQPVSSGPPEPGSYQALFREVMLDDLRRDRPLATYVQPVEHVTSEPGQTEAIDGFDFRVEAPLESLS